ncbi:MAG: S1 family peptidase, partial [Nannocystaceae bacterium]|nr:S1 family peptidase [Nannocystaceae bacterium]
MALPFLGLLLPLLAASSATAHASPPTAADAPLVASVKPSTIIGGDDVPGCGWPNVVRLLREDGSLLCSATLIHPSIVATAGHCALSPSGAPASVLFGDGSGEPGLAREIEFCMAHPDFVYSTSGITYDNHDLAFCQLSEPVEDLPIIPLAYGCDYTELQGVTPVDIVGFGLDENDEAGIKQALEVNTVLFEPSGEIQLTPATCSGDSGGGVFRDAADGTKRQVGIISHRLVPQGVSLACGTPGTVSVATAAWQVAPLVEANTNFDVTPCHDIDGNWEPSLQCQGVPLDPWDGGDG